LCLGPVALQWLCGFDKQKVACGACDFGCPTEFILFGKSSHSRRIFIGSHSLPLSGCLIGPSGLVAWAPGSAVRTAEGRRRLAHRWWPYCNAGSAGATWFGRAARLMTLRGLAGAMVVRLSLQRGHGDPQRAGWCHDGWPALLCEVRRHGGARLLLQRLRWWEVCDSCWLCCFGRGGGGAALTLHHCVGTAAGR
jgi:hypothetical protein